MFDTVISLPTDPNIGHDQSLGGDGSTTQLNISGGGSVRTFFDANSGCEVNISGGSIGFFADARSGSEVNISGGSVGRGFRAFSGSVVNISGGRIGDNFHAFRDSKINILGSGFALDGVPLEDSLPMDVAFTIDDRDVILSGRLADGSAFSFDLNTVFPTTNDEDLFLPTAILTVTRVTAVTPTFAQTITHVPLFTFTGDTAIGFGRSVSGAGDVNGDGFDDVIIGARGFRVNGNGLFPGRAQVLSGVDGSLLHTFEGESVGTGFGGSVSGAGDVNGDGFDDLIVGAARDDNNGQFRGSVQVFSGVDGSVLYSFEGDSDISLSNVSVSGAGDVNGDGFDDLILGAGFAGNNGSQSGIARVISGIDASLLYEFDGDLEFDRLGFSVSDAGDVNGDGFADLIVGAPLTDLFGQANGSARVFSGADGRVLYDFDGDSSFDEFGAVVSGAGDVNGDGFADLLVGAPGNINNGTDAGTARVFSGADGSVLYHLDGDSDYSMYGSSVSSAGDVNGDGVADFIVGTGNGISRIGGYAQLYVSQITAPVLILGDCNQDGEVNFLDINPFISFLSSNTYLQQADTNEDGAVNFLDIAPFIEILADN